MSKHEEKHRSQQIDEDRKPLQAYREEERHEMRQNFFGADRSYHPARQRFVYQGPVPGHSLQEANGS